MTSEEMTTGSISMGENERKVLAARSRWWNSTGGGTCSDRGYGDLDDAGGGWKSYVGMPGRTTGGPSNVMKPGDGGERFRQEFPELDAENWRWMRERRFNLQTGIALSPEGSSGRQGSVGGPSHPPSIQQQQQQQQQQRQQQEQEAAGLRRRQVIAAAAGTGASGAAGTAGAVVKGGESWLRRHKFLCAVVLLCGYVLLARLYE